MILVTGFRLTNEAVNASGKLVHSLAENLPEALLPIKDRLVFKVITCDDSSRDAEQNSLETQLNDLIAHYQPKLCIHIGQAPLYNKFTIERIGTNSFKQSISYPDRPVAYWADLPGIETLKSVLEDNGIPAGYSFYAGQHLCNLSLYLSRYIAEQKGLSHHAGFIHIPILPEQAMTDYPNAPYLSLEETRKAISIIIDHVAEADGSI